ncbi:hypothetical protein [Streptomyces sp. NBC_00046]|uniref:hypothetical protein n=1 Tax=Streptomyces sp. NBC_00046 TaxID=2975626 RepID=UPI002F9199A7
MQTSRPELNGCPVRIIDFDDCGTGHYLLDNATVPLPVQAYAEGRPYPGALTSEQF